MVVGAVFGARLASKRRVPLFGVLLAGVVAGLGGGIVRDVLLGLEPAAITTWYYIPAVLLAAIVGGLAAPRMNLSRLPFVAAQGVSIGLLVGIGVQKAVEYRAPAPSAILLGVVTATFGGALGDVLAGERAAIMREGHWFLSTTVCGSVVFYLTTLLRPPFRRRCKRGSGDKLVSGTAASPDIPNDPTSADRAPA
jgi:uncharacterized membrane protein YeiH